jgi:hypothetical protein
MNEPFIHQEIPDEALRRNIPIITGDNSAVMSAGNRKFFASSVANCRYASELTFRPIAVCFLRPCRNIIRLLEKNEYFSLCYFPSQHRHIRDSFGSGFDGEKIEPKTTQLGNIYYPQAELIFECRKIMNLEVILSNEIQNILADEKRLSLYPGNESPRMFVAEIVHGWHKVLPSLASGNVGKILPESKQTKLLCSGG